MLKDALNEVLAHRDLPEDTMRDLLEEYIEGKTDPVQLGGFLMAMRMKGVARSELTGAARFLMRHAISIDTGLSSTVDLVGTGGDGGVSFNISTTSSFVAAGAGVRMAKHGNRAMSGKSGAADVLAACGFDLNCPAERMEQAIQKIGIGFLFAQRMHPVLGKVGPVRKALGTRTIFNLLGPLCNPAKVSSIVIGVYDAALTELIAGTLADLGIKHALVVHGLDGLDELTVTTASRVTELQPDGSVTTRDLFPELILGQRYPAAEIAGGTPEENAVILKDVLSGKRRDGARAIVVLNAASAIYVAGLADSLEHAVPLAETSIDSGRALEKFTALMEFSHGA